MTVRRGDDGWLEIPHTGSPTDQCWIGFGQREPEEWVPAFKRTKGKRRVLAVPPPTWRGTVVAWTRINGVERREGTIRL